MPSVHLQQNSKQRPVKWNAWAERQSTMQSTWIDRNELVLTKPGGMGGGVRERVPSKLWGLICPSKLEKARPLTCTWLAWEKLDACFPFFLGHYRQIRTAARINSLIGSVKQTETSNGRTIEWNSMSRRLRCLNQWTRSAFKVSIIMQVVKTIGKCQAKTIQSASHIGIRPVGLFCNKPAVDIGRANYEGSSYATG